MICDRAFCSIVGRWPAPRQPICDVEIFLARSGKWKYPNKIRNTPSKINIHTAAGANVNNKYYSKRQIGLFIAINGTISRWNYMHTTSRTHPRAHDSDSYLNSHLHHSSCHCCCCCCSDKIAVSIIQPSIDIRWRTDGRTERHTPVFASDATADVRK